MNLEIASFIKEINAFIENVNEIDSETIGLLNEISLAVNKLRKNSKLNETSYSKKRGLLQALNGEHFVNRRFIFCNLCQVSKQIEVCMFLSCIEHVATMTSS